jgi:AcrR family transcriptional regulator
MRDDPELLTTIRQMRKQVAGNGPERIRIARDFSRVSLPTRQRLLAAARRVFPERGFYGTSLEAVAEEAGLTKGAVMADFRSGYSLLSGVATQ